MTSMGIEADIWKIRYISLDVFEKYGSITMCLFFNESADQYIDSITQVILEEDFDTYFANSTDIYADAERFMMERCDIFCSEKNTL